MLSSKLDLRLLGRKKNPEISDYFAMRLEKFFVCVCVCVCVCECICVSVKLDTGDKVVACF